MFEADYSNIDGTAPADDLINYRWTGYFWAENSPLGVMFAGHSRRDCPALAIHAYRRIIGFNYPAHCTQDDKGIQGGAGQIFVKTGIHARLHSTESQYL